MKTKRSLFYQLEEASILFYGDKLIEAYKQAKTALKVINQRLFSPGAT